MAVYFQFKSSIVKESISVDGPFITVGDLKESIIERKQLRRGKRRIDSDLVISDYNTKVDYIDDGALIPCYTTVLVRRVPVQASFPIIVDPPPVPAKPEEPEVVERDPDDLEWEELINSDPYEPESFPSQSQNPAPVSTVMNEDSKIKALVETPALDWGRLGGRGFGGKTPPQGYVCHRCKVAGHFIQYCPTNGDPDYDIKRLRPPTGILKSMLVATPDGSYALPTGAVAVLRPNEAAFDKAMEGVPSSARSVGHLPHELYCRICKQVMQYAVLTSRCCYDSFCDKCIRERIITKASCVCGATNVLADDLIPNVTLRNTISRILQLKSSSSSSSSGEAEKQEVVGDKHESVSVKESAPAASQESAPLADEDVQQRPVFDEAAKKKAQEITPAAAQENAPLADEDVQQRPLSDEAAKKKARLATPVAAENNMMSMGAYNPYWGGMQPGMNAFMPPYGGGYGYGYGYGYGFGPMNMPFGEQGMTAYGMESNAEARRANGKRKRDTESSREAPKDGSGNMSSSKFRSQDAPPASSSHHAHRRHSDRPSPDQRSRDHYRDSDHSLVRDHYLDNNHHHDRDHPCRSSSHHRSGRLHPQGFGLRGGSSRIRARD